MLELFNQNSKKNNNNNGLDEEDEELDEEELSTTNDITKMSPSRDISDTNNEKSLIEDKINSPEDLLLLKMEKPEGIY